MTNSNLTKAQRDNLIRKARDLQEQLDELTAEVHRMFDADAAARTYAPRWEVDYDRRLRLIHRNRRQLTEITSAVGRLPPRRRVLTTEQKLQREERRQQANDEATGGRVLRKLHRDRAEQQARLTELGFQLPIPEGPLAPLPGGPVSLVKGNTIKSGPRAGNRELRTRFDHGDTPVALMQAHNAQLDANRAAVAEYEAHRRRLLDAHVDGRIVLSEEDMAAIEEFRQEPSSTPYFNVVTGELEGPRYV